MEVEIWSDIACPWCYIGKRRFEAALERFEHRDDVHVTWRSFELDPYGAARARGRPRRAFAEKYGITVEQAREMEQRADATRPPARASTSASTSRAAARRSTATGSSTWPASMACRTR